jgi:tRNA threonylcarbamoyladenosine biosynthesis protein TsaB
MKCKELIKHEKAHFISGLIPSAVQLGELGFKKWKTQQIEDVASFEPYYLKEFMIKKPNLA